ncbi:hypothetical protein [Thiocystis minor]|uniref:hypothetical protein n=1 Tax=Thiocystis minor TaxID=61597 RepID=UPI0019142768|nr:hypothetical protein [Thiocystis minor]
MGKSQQARRDGQVPDSKKLAAEGWKLTVLYRLKDALKDPLRDIIKVWSIIMYRPASS